MTQTNSTTTAVRDAISAAPPVSPDRLMTLGNGFWVSQIVSAAAHYKFFTLIAQGRRTVEAIATAAGTDPTGTRMVLDSLVGLELVTKHNGIYGLTPEADAFLVNGKPGDLSILFAEHTPLIWNQWGHLADALKNHNVVRQFAKADAGREFFPKLIRAIMPLGLGAADATAEHLGVGTRRTGLRILDIGAGAGTWSIPFATRDPACDITAFDLPEVLVETRKIVDQFGVGDRYRIVAGDLRSDDFGDKQYELAILGNICHGLTPEENRDLLARTHRALAPNGQLVIADMLPNEERTGPPFALLFAVNMYVMGGADTYPLSDYRKWLKGAGYSDVTTFDTKRSHSPVIIATR